MDSPVLGEGVKTLDQLRPQHDGYDVKGFFVQYNKLHDEQFQIRGEHGPRRASKLVKIGTAAYQKKSKAD